MFVRIGSLLPEWEKGRRIPRKKNNIRENREVWDRCDMMFSLDVYSLAGTEAGMMSTDHFTKQPEFFFWSSQNWKYPGALVKMPIYRLPERPVAIRIPEKGDQAGNRNRRTCSARSMYVNPLPIEWPFSSTISIHCFSLYFSPIPVSCMLTASTAPNFDLLWLLLDWLRLTPSVTSTRNRHLNLDLAAPFSSDYRERNRGEKSEKKGRKRVRCCIEWAMSPLQLQ